MGRYRWPVLEIASRALALVAVIVIGQVLKLTGVLRSEHVRPLSAVLLWVTLPGALLTAFNGQSLDSRLLVLPLLAAGLTAAQLVIGYLMAAGEDRRARAFAVFNSGGYNIGGFASPYLSGILGPAALIPTTMFDMGAAFVSSGLAYGWGSVLADPDGGNRGRRILKAVAGSPVFLTYLVVLLLALSRVELPAAVIAVTSIAGAANPFVAMLVIGVALDPRLGRRKLLLAARFLAVRYLVALFAATAVWFWLPVTAEIKVITCVLLFSPMPVMLSAFTARAGLDVELSGFLTSASILVGVIVMPGVLLLAG